MAFKEPGNLSQVCKVYNGGVKHEAQGPEAAQQRLQSGPLDGFGKCEGVHRIDILQLFLLIKPPAFYLFLMFALVSLASKVSVTSPPCVTETVFCHLGYRVAENKEGRETPQMHVKCD